MENPRFPVSLFTAGVLCLLAVLILTLASAPCAAGSDIDIAELKAMAEQGDRRGPVQPRALRTDSGMGCPKDYAEAVKWYRKAAEQGDAEAQFNLGLMYADGEGVPKDYAEAVKWYRKAAEQCSNLGCSIDARS